MIDRNIKREIMLDNYQNPFNKYVPNDKSYIKVNTNNESCIDNLDIYFKIEDNIIKDITFFGEACAISTSATSIMNRLLIGKTKEEVLNILDNYENMINEKEYNKERDGKDNCIFKINDGIKIVDSIEDEREMMNMSFYLGDYITALNSQIGLHENNMSIIEIELRKRQEILQEATNSRRAVEILKEKKLAEYKKLINKEEQSKLDEWKKEYIS